jgi:uncharacterized membrane protein YebE (DUF533 family)
MLGRLFQSSTERDGASSVLEAVATGIDPTMLEPSAEIAMPLAAGRRDRVLTGGRRDLMDSMAEKVLRGWLQNRHQTLFPLTVNLRTLNSDQAATLARWTAVAALATRDPAQKDAATTRAWLASVGADAASLAVLDAALAEPPALDRTLAAIAGQGVSAYAYIAALIATDPHDPATPPFLGYVVARLALPSTLVRSATRRYRR